MNNKAVEYFRQGYSCSEAIIKAGIDQGLVSKELLPVATAFSGGMSSGCLCGAVAGAQLVVGATNGKIDNERDGQNSRKLAKEIIDEFKNIHNVTCCKALTVGFEFHSPERKEHCVKMVDDCAKILTKVLELNKEKV